MHVNRYNIQTESTVLVLQVKYVQARDAGVYECQVGTEPKMSHFVQLNVVGQWPCPCALLK